MFCRNCGKDIGDSKFCPNCGQSAALETPAAPTGNTPDSLIKKIRVIGHGRLMTLPSLAATAISIVIRLCNNELETVYSMLSSDDYFVLAESARGWILALMGLQILWDAFLLYDYKREADEFPMACDFPTGSVIGAIFLLAVQAAAMLLRFPAPY